MNDKTATKPSETTNSNFSEGIYDRLATPPQRPVSSTTDILNKMRERNDQYFSIGKKDGLEEFYSLPEEQRINTMIMVYELRFHSDYPTFASQFLKVATRIMELSGRPVMSITHLGVFITDTMLKDLEQQERTLSAAYGRYLSNPRELSSTIPDMVTKQGAKDCFYIQVERCKERGQHFDHAARLSGLPVFVAECWLKEKEDAEGLSKCAE